jgi:hypothetical protein
MSPFIPPIYTLIYQLFPSSSDSSFISHYYFRYPLNSFTHFKCLLPHFKQWPLLMIYYSGTCFINVINSNPCFQNNNFIIIYMKIENLNLFSNYSYSLTASNLLPPFSPAQLSIPILIILHHSLFYSLIAPPDSTFTSANILHHPPSPFPTPTFYLFPSYHTKSSNIYYSFFYPFVAFLIFNP